MAAAALFALRDRALREGGPLITLTKQSALDQLADLVKTGDWLDALTIHLFVNNITIQAGTVAADFTDSTTPGLTPVALGAWGPAFVDGIGNAWVAAPSIEFRATADNTDVIYGYWVSAVVSTVVTFRFGENFPNPVGIPNGRAAIIVPRYSTPSLGSAALVGP